MSTGEYFRLGPAIPARERDGFEWQKQLLFFVVAVLLVISRRPDAVTNPQFFAEDGMFWYADAYNIGWLHALFIPHTGYFQSLPRLTAAFSLLVPLQFAPLFLNIVAIVIQVVPAILLLTARFSSWGSLGLRLGMASVYLALPNSRELDAAITEAQWHLALIACLVVLATPSNGRLWRIFDVAMVLLSGLTGPFCLVLCPVALAIWAKYRHRWRLVVASLVTMCAVIQLTALFLTGTATRSQAELGATAKRFFEMLVGNIYLGALIGQNHLALHGSAWMLVLVGIFASALVGYCFLRANLEWRLFLLYCLALYLASLHNPMISYEQPQWAVLEDAPGLRYWFFPMLAFAWAALWCVFRGRSKGFRVLGAAATLCMLVGIKKDWTYIPFSDHNFFTYVRRFEALPAGVPMVFPLYPDGWTMQLVKKGLTCASMPSGYLDQPRPHTEVNGPLLVSGWVTSESPLDQVSVLLDGEVREKVQPTFSRPDVDAKFPGSPVKNKGWQTTLDLSSSKPGEHVIEVHARLQDGCETILGTAVIQNKLSTASPQ